MSTSKPHQPKVLHVLSDVLPGGAEVMLLALLKQQHANHTCDSIVASLEDHGEPNSLRPSIEKVAGFHHLDCTSFFSREFTSKFKKLLDQEKPDVVHAWSHDSGLVAGLIARYQYGIKVVWGIHALDLPSRHEYTALRFGILKTIVGIGSRFIPNRIISCSSIATDAHVRFGYPRKRCVTIANGVDTERYQPNEKSAAASRNQLGISSNSPIVGYVGRSHPVKCLEHFFSAAGLIMDQRSDVHFVALGFTADDLYPLAREAYEELPDTSRMHLMGSCPDIEKYLAAITINVLCSKSEAMPMVLMEALSCGVPCVCTDVGSSKDVVGEIGSSVAAGNPVILAEATLKLLDQVIGDREQWAKKARARALKHFSIMKAEKKHTQIYSDLSEKSGARAPRILNLVNSLDVGGAQTVLSRLAGGLDQQGFEQSVVSVLPPGKITPWFTEAGIPVQSLDARGLFSGIRGVFRMARIIRKEKPDLIQTWMFHSAIIGELAGLLSMRSPRVLWSIHHTKLGKESSKFTTRMIQRTLAFLSSRSPERIIYCSQSSQDLHIEDGFDASKSQLIFNGTDIELYKADDSAKQEVRDRYNIPMDAPVVGMAGRYHPQKDFANLLRAFALVQKSIPEAHLIACGPDVSRDTEALRELADLCPSPSQVHLIGSHLNMQKIYPAFSLASLSSCEGEAFPLVLGEAMACEVPCVATDLGDSALIIGDTGKIVQPRDSEALAVAMVDMLSLGESLQEKGKQARQRVADRFALSLCVNTHADLYRSLVEPNQPVAQDDSYKAVTSSQQAVSH